MKSAKIIRKYYKRLYCIPDSAESTQFNSIIAAKGATTERHKVGYHCVGFFIPPYVCASNCSQMKECYSCNGSCCCVIRERFEGISLVSSFSMNFEQKVDIMYS